MSRDVDMRKERARREAEGWFVRLRSGEATREDRLRHEDWLAKDPQNRTAYDEILRVWARTDIADAVLRERLGRDAHTTARRSVLRPGGVRAPVAVAACLALVGLLLYAGGLKFFDLRDEYRTHTGEQKTVALKDRSLVHLNTQSRLYVDYDARKRTVVLDYGEAMFDVAHDPARPFVVEAGGLLVRAVGTRFNILSLAGETRLSVLEGTVAVRRAEGGRDVSARPPVRLERGQKLVSRRDGMIGPVGPANLDRVSAWRRGQLYYDQAPLADIVADLNRYYEGQVVIADAELGRLTISGIFDNNGKRALLQVIEKLLPVRLVDASDGRTFILRARGSGETTETTGRETKFRAGADGLISPEKPDQSIKKSSPMEVS